MTHFNIDAALKSDLSKYGLTNVCVLCDWSNVRNAKTQFTEFVDDVHKVAKELHLTCQLPSDNCELKNANTDRVGSTSIAFDDNQKIAVLLTPFSTFCCMFQYGNADERQAFCDRLFAVVEKRTGSRPRRIDLEEPLIAYVVNEAPKTACSLHSKSTATVSNTRANK